MFDIEISPSKPEKLPTFLQFMREQSLTSAAENRTFFGIELIWLPGRFDNVTLQTHAFRYILLPSTELYQPTIEYVAGLSRDEKVPQIGVVITSLKQGTIKLKQHPKQRVRWEPLGQNGLKAVEV